MFKIRDKAYTKCIVLFREEKEKPAAPAEQTEKKG